MLYLMCFVFPPLACLGAGRFLHAVLNTFFFLSIVGYPVAVAHAWFVVKGVDDERLNRQARLTIYNHPNYRGRKRA